MQGAPAQAGSALFHFKPPLISAREIKNPYLRQRCPQIIVLRPVMIFTLRLNFSTVIAVT